MNKATLYIPQEEYKDLKIILMMENLSVSEWFRGKVREEIKNYATKQQRKRQERGEVVQEPAVEVLSRDQA